MDFVSTVISLNAYTYHNIDEKQSQTLIQGGGKLSLGWAGGLSRGKGIILTPTLDDLHVATTFITADK